MGLQGSYDFMCLVCCLNMVKVCAKFLKILPTIDTYWADTDYYYVTVGLMEWPWPCVKVNNSYALHIISIWWIFCVKWFENPQGLNDYWVNTKYCCLTFGHQKRPRERGQLLLGSAHRLNVVKNLPSYLKNPPRGWRVTEQIRVREGRTDRETDREKPLFPPLWGAW